MSKNRRNGTGAVSLTLSVLALLCASGCGPFRADSLVRRSPATTTESPPTTAPAEDIQAQLMTDSALRAAAALLPQLPEQEKRPAALRRCVHVELVATRDNSLVARIVCSHNDRVTARDIANAMATAYVNAKTSGESREILQRALLPAKRRKWL